MHLKHDVIEDSSEIDARSFLDPVSIDMKKAFVDDVNYISVFLAFDEFQPRKPRRYEANRRLPGRRALRDYDAWVGYGNWVRKRSVHLLDRKPAIVLFAHVVQVVPPTQ